VSTYLAQPPAGALAGGATLTVAVVMPIKLGTTMMEGALQEQAGCEREREAGGESRIASSGGSCAR
jgi:hypothetical protein